MTKPNHRGQLFRKTVLVLLGTGLLFAIMATVLNIWLGQKNIRQEQISQLEKSIQPRLPNLANALWDIDSTLIRQELDFLVSLPDVSRVELNTPLGQSYVQGRFDKTQSSLESLNYEIRHPQSTTPLGNITFLIQNRPLWSSQKNSSMLLLGMHLLQITAMLVLLNILLRRPILRRIKILTSHLQKLHQHTLHQPPPGIPADKPDELDDLGSALLQAQQNLILDQQAGRQTEAALRNKLERTENELAHRTGEAVYISGFLSQLLRLSTDFLHLPPSQTEPALREALQEIGVFLGLDTCFVIAIREDNQAIITGFWRKETLPVAPLEVYYTRSRADYASSLGLLAEEKLVQIDPGKLDADSQEARLARLLKLEKLILVKLDSSAQAVGLLCGGTCDPHRLVNDIEGRLFCMTGNIIASLLVNQQAQARLQTISAELDQARTEITALISQDPLTGLSNERAFHETVSRELRRAQRIGSPLALVVLEVDRQAESADQRGCNANDTALQSIAAELVRNVSRTGDLIARIGPARFALLLPDTPAEGALALAQSLHGTLSAPAVNGTDQQALSVSVALIRCKQCHLAELEPLLDLATQALNQAQHNGGNCIEIIDAQ